LSFKVHRSAISGGIHEKVIVQEPSVQPVIHDRYQVVSLIASGGLGHVYYGWDLQLHRAVAIKRLRQDVAGGEAQLEAAWTEARTLAAMQHPNIVTLYDFGVDEVGAFYVLEYVEGETLEVAVAREVLTQEQFLEVARQSLEAIHAAHQGGIIHRDLKPGNIMLKPSVTGRPEVKVLDFGLARFQETPRPQTLDKDNSIAGSIHFVAPEQFEKKPVDPRTDLYMLGNVFYYALTNRHAHDGRTVYEVIRSHLSGTFVPLARLRPDLDGRLVLWIESLMQRNPSGRPATAADALQRLMRMHTQPVLLAPAAATKGASPRLWLALAAMLIGAPGMLWFFFFSKGNPRPVPVVPIVPAAETNAGAVDASDLAALRAGIGRSVRVRGTLVDYGENKAGTICYLNFSKDYHEGLALVFFKADNADFTEEKLKPFVGRTVEVSGKISEHKGALQMKIWTLDRIVAAP
jgi:tRNA A-37 threonylcarbamoyl transferase component Bud32